MNNIIRCGDYKFTFEETKSQNIMSTENLINKDAVKKLKELSESARICMFCTELTQLRTIHGQ